MNDTTTGLFLGKFAPLHKGHQYCINIAQNYCDELVLMIYDEPHVTDIPLLTRVEWLRDLYPQATIIEAWNGPDEAGYDDHTAAKHEYYVQQELESHGISNIDIYFSSEPYGEHMSNSLDAIDYRVDGPRSRVPISGTAVRAAFESGDPDEVREYVCDRVWEDLVTNVVVLGGPSTGKTTLCKALADEFDEPWQPEVGREFWENHADENGMLSERQLLKLASNHITEEDKTLREAGRYLFTDTNAITTGLFSKWYHGSMEGILRMEMKENISRYDVFILCDDDIPFEEEEGRGGPKGRHRLQRMHESWLNSNGVEFHRVSGSVEERVEQVKEILENFNKWDHER